MQYLIYNTRTKSYWRRPGNGTTEYKHRAHLYTKDDARKAISCIVNSSTRGNLVLVELTSEDWKERELKRTDAEKKADIIGLIDLDKLSLSQLRMVQIMTNPFYETAVAIDDEGRVVYGTVKKRA